MESDLRKATDVAEMDSGVMKSRLGVIHWGISFAKREFLSISEAVALPLPANLISEPTVIQSASCCSPYPIRVLELQNQLCRQPAGQ